MDNMTQSDEYDQEEVYGGFDPYEYPISDTLCPNCESEYMREVAWATSPDDYTMGLICPNCRYEERD